MKRIFIIAITMVLMLSLAACGTGQNTANNDAGDSGNGNAAPEVQTFSSTTSSLTIEAPSSWTEQNTNPDVTIEIGSQTAEQLFAVMEVPASDFPEGFTVDDVAQLTLDNFKTGIEMNDDPSLSTTTVGNGQDARQFEFTGTVEGEEITYLITITKVNDIYYTMIGTTIPSQFDVAKPVFQKIIASATF